MPAQEEGKSATAFDSWPSTFGGAARGERVRVSSLKIWAHASVCGIQVFGTIAPKDEGAAPRAVQSGVLGCEGGLEAQELVLAPDEAIACVIFWQPIGRCGKAHPERAVGLRAEFHETR